MDVSSRLNYGYLMQKAMRGVMAEVMSLVAENGLPGDHHFYITFETDHPGVDIPKWLHDRYPDEMTIVLQDWFDDIAVTPDRFSVRLNFSDQPQTLVVPFAAVRTFVDPSVKFGLKFEAQEAGDPDLDAALKANEAEDTEDSDAPPPPPRDDGPGADVVRLDRFRKQ